MKKTDSIDSFDQRSIQSARLADFLPAYRAALRRAVMKTQATQTDTNSRRSTNRSIRRSIPAYLTLSPRTSKPDTEQGFCVHSYDSDDEEDVLQISVKVFSAFIHTFDRYSHNFCFFRRKRLESLQKHELLKK